MAIDRRAELQRIRTFPSLIAYLRNELGWPIESDDFEELTFDYTPDELGIDSASAAKIQEIKRLRPLAPSQPWGIFFVKFEPKQLPVVALRRILSRVVLKKRAASNSDERAAWAADDLLFVSTYGRSDARQISFAHFSQEESRLALPVLKVLGWDNQDTQLHLDHIVDTLHAHLSWPDDDGDVDVDAWRTTWRGAFTVRHREVVTTSKLLAVRLAELARAIRDRIAGALAIETADGPLTTLMNTFREALVHDLDAGHFADMYAQTIAYGLLSARIADPTTGTVDDLAGHMRTNPFLRELMDSFLSAGGKRNGDSPAKIDFDELGINEVIDLLDDANMGAVLRDFGDRNPQEDPVIHFYELFLKEYDAKRRMQRGVFYTPRPVVTYIVRSVDELLRDKFGLEDGLADTTTWEEMLRRHPDLEMATGAKVTDAFIQVLDPATGTGTFLVEVIDLIYETMLGKWQSQGRSATEIGELWNGYVAAHLLTRLHGYELLMAPYAIAHLKVGLKLYETGYRFQSDERARIYLTNALEPAHDFSGQFEFAIPALAREAEAVNAVKRSGRFTVVLGNPPYSKISSNLTPEMRAIVERYRYVDGAKIKERGALQFEINLQDDYVKFMRLCEERVGATATGVLGLITNNGYLSTPTLRGMRESLMETFNALWLVDLHGHLAKGERGPDGAQEENVFDILQGVALLLGCALPDPNDPVVSHAERYGSRTEKYGFLQSSSLATTTFDEMRPSSPFYLFVPHDTDLEAEWRQFAGLVEVFPRNSAGIITARDALVIGLDKKDLARRLERFSTSALEDAAIYAEFGFSASKRFDLHAAQSELRELESFDEPIRPILHRPFDERLLFFHPSVVWSLSRPMADQMVSEDNLALVATRQVTRPQFEHAFVSRHMIEIKACSHDRNTQIFPLFTNEATDGFFAATPGAPNVDVAFLERLARELGLELRADVRNLGGDDELTPRRLFNYVYAVLYAPTYRERYFEFLRSDFPRLPTPGSAALFRELVQLGGSLVKLHLLESPELDRAVSGVTDPDEPEVTRVAWSDDTIWLDAHTAVPGQQPRPGTVGFVGVTEEVWNFRIGGYQVCDKWLKDRKGRSLTKDETRRYRRVLTALAGTIRIMEEIDASIAKNGGWPDAFARHD